MTPTDPDVAVHPALIAACSLLAAAAERLGLPEDGWVDLDRLETLALRADHLDWTEASESSWAADGNGYQAVAVWEAPFLFVVTHADAATAMGVAEAVADEL